MRASADRSLIWLIVAIVAALALVVVAGGFVMGIAMSGGHGACCGMMGGSGADQTPFVTSDLEVTVDIRDSQYFPKDLTVDQGATVTWLNHDTVPHNASSDNDAWDMQLLQKNDVAAITFDDPGTFPYHCTLHSYMRGTVTVRTR